MRTRALFIGAALHLLAAGCSPKSGTGPPVPLRRFTDGLGRAVEAPVPARRIASLAPSNTEILFALGAGEQVVARDDHSDYPPAVRARPGVGTAGGQIHREVLMGLGPDLVLAAEISSPEQVKSLESLGLTVFLVANPRSFEGLHGNIRLLGEISGRESQAEELVAQLERRVRAVEERLRGVRERPRVFYEIDGTNPSLPWTAGPRTFMHMLLTAAGGENLGASYDHPFPRVSAEEVIVMDPEVIILGDARFGISVESVGRRAGWSGISAVRSGRVHVFDDDLASRPGPRLVDGLETLARLLHPRLFAE